MKRLLIAGAIAAAAFSAYAQVKVSELPAATSVADADLSIVVQGGATKKAELSVLKTFVSDSPALVTPDIGAATGTSLVLSGDITAANLVTLPGSTAQGDTLYLSAASTLARLAKDTNATRYLSNTGSSNNPAWAQVNVANGVTDTLPVANGGTGGATVQAATQALTVPRVIFKQGLPMVYMSSGTMTSSPNGNGAFTALTAITGGIPGRALCYMPANSVATVSAAGWYFCTFSSTTAGNIVDTTPYTPSATPPVWPASPTTPTTASSWTGATGAVTAISFSVPANSMGANGLFEVPHMFAAATNNANAKSLTHAFGALSSGALSLASIATAITYAKVANQGTANNIIHSNAGSSFVYGATIVGTVDTTSAVTFTLSLSKGTATDNVGIMPFQALILSDGT